MAPRIIIAFAAAALVAGCGGSSESRDDDRTDTPSDARRIPDARPPTPDAGRAHPSSVTICLLPLGPHEPQHLRTAAAGIEYLFGFQVRQLPARELPIATYYPPRKRYRAEKVLDYIDAEVVPDAGCHAVMGFTKVDISTTKGDKVDWGILGLGSIGGTSAVVSTFRMKGTRSKKVLGQRVVKVVNHELGHVLGLPHYTGAEENCLMEDARGTVKTVDRESGLLCTESRATIESRMNIELPERPAFDWDAVLR